MPTDTPYTEADVKACNKILFDLNNLLEDFDKQEGCGIDCSELRLRQADLVKQLQTWKAQYFPGR